MSNNDDMRETLRILQEDGVELPEEELIKIVFKLYKLAKALQKCNLTACTWGLSGKQEKNKERRRKEVTELLEIIKRTCEFNGDPRGYPFRIILDNGRTNSWFGYGWGIE